jgi:hypothetical protein
MFCLFTLGAVMPGAAAYTVTEFKLHADSAEAIQIQTGLGKTKIVVLLFSQRV